LGDLGDAVLDEPGFVALAQVVEVQPAIERGDAVVGVALGGGMPVTAVEAGAAVQAAVAADVLWQEVPAGWQGPGPAVWSRHRGRRRGQDCRRSRVETPTAIGTLRLDRDPVDRAGTAGENGMCRASWHTVATVYRRR
jgi:hypothetical protein